MFMDCFFSTTGASGRMHFVGHIIFWALLLITWKAMFLAAFNLPILMLTIFLVMALLLFLSHIAVSIRRLHDLGFSGWWYVPAALLWWVPLMAVIVFDTLNGDKWAREFRASPHEFIIEYGPMLQTTYLPFLIIGIGTLLALLLWPGKKESNPYL